MHRVSRWSTGLALSALLAVACSNPSAPEVADPDLVANAIDRFLSEDGVTAPDYPLGYKIFDLEGAAIDGPLTQETCDGVELELAPVCDEIRSAGEADYCSYMATFFYANDVPRCAVRFETYSNSFPDSLHPTYVFDFSGDALGTTPPSCGNGVLDGDEQCDDGNLENWDGCDVHCAQEPFTGCEAVIETYFRDTGLAEITQDSWQSPRSHLMVTTGRAMVPVDATTCAAAHATGVDVCNELTSAMPFVSWCFPESELHEDEGGSACSVRLHVQFHQLDSEFGVYTTALEGLLAFTIR